MSFIFFFFNDTATTEIYTLSLHDALPISLPDSSSTGSPRKRKRRYSPSARRRRPSTSNGRPVCSASRKTSSTRSEEHTSELQSHLNLVCRLLLEKKKNLNKVISRYNIRNA